MLLARGGAIARRVQRRARYRLLRLAGVNVLDNYAAAAPSAQQTLDIFAGEFSSAMPPELGDVRAGAVPLFDDERIDWLAEHLALDGLDVLELGPLEGGHTYMLARLGARHVTAVESNSRAFLKCLVVKELVGLDDVSFKYGDFVEYLRETDGHFDLCVASGVLYHMRRPVELLELIATASDRLFLWTHYYDEAYIAATPNLASKFDGHEQESSAIGTYTVHRYVYGPEALSTQSFCGGSAAYANWLSRDDILTCLRGLGLSEIDIAFDRREGGGAPGLALLAQRPGLAGS